jgi:hypothetical protein
VTRRLCTIAGFYKYAVEEELLDHSPAVHVRRPRVDYESHATALDRNELGALLVAAGLGPPPEHTLTSLLATHKQDAVAEDRQIACLPPVLLPILPPDGPFRRYSLWPEPAAQG